MTSTLTQQAQAFKECPCCGKPWLTREMFLSDPAIEIVGYQVTFNELELGYFLFNHLVDDCGTTMAVEAGDFKDLYNGPIYSNPLTNTEQCLEYCLNKYDLRPCTAECVCAWTREIIQIILHWRKN